jgi:predicted RND superfamily exporter protein
MSGRAIPGSFLVVFLLMVIAFRSLPLGALSMIPMGLAILFSYGLVGWAGKDFDMPIAVCSSIALGMGIDLAIHFLERFREHYGKHRNLEASTRHMFGEPGRAIARNAVVITLGFLPLVVSSLTPYVTVGLFFAMLMVFSTLGTIYILPAALRLAGPYILRERSTS